MAIKEKVQQKVQKVHGWWWRRCHDLKMAFVHLFHIDGILECAERRVAALKQWATDELKCVENDKPATKSGDREKTTKQNSSDD
ncbi:hypothetical protein [Heliothis virescens ascovirus 3j]|uniref:Uncharacterized protein n=1 Tax=Heliothis virescens ascovirus 3j TaxID=1561067 RepID=A0A2Z5UZH1_9VIRU|nr:hypothetical protein [Heliothis virescens ascovirus 3j]